MLKSRPPVPETPEEFEKVKNDFIIGNSSIKKTSNLPWEAPQVRQDVKKLFSLRLSEPDMLKLQYINQKTGISMHQFVLNHLIPAIEKEIKHLTSETS